MIILLAALLSDINAAEHFGLYVGQTPRTRSLVQPYFDCAFNAAGKLDKAGDAPSEVAKAAMTVCSDKRDALLAAMDTDWMMSGSSELGITDRVLKNFDAWMLAHLQMRLVGKHAIERR